MRGDASSIVIGATETRLATQQPHNERLGHAPVDALRDDDDDDDDDDQSKEVRLASSPMMTRLRARRNANGSAGRRHPVCGAQLQDIR